MQPYPLFKTKLSNERLMSALLLPLLLFNLPRFIARPAAIMELLLLAVIGLALDAAIHFILHKRPVCAVPAAVTALILFSLSPGAHFWAEVAALAAALIAGKAVWGGTGKNPLNPAIAGLLLLAFISPAASPGFEPTLLLLPAAALSLPFLLVRPYAGVGMILGMAAALLSQGSYTFMSLMSGGVFFYGCLVITDPVTTTSKPIAGFVIGVLAGFVPLMTGGAAFVMPAALLASNILSYLADRFDLGGNEKLRKTFGKRQKIAFSPGTARFTDLTDGEMPNMDMPDIDCDVLFDRIARAKITGFGGAAFPTAVKLRAAAECARPEKHLIVNAAECDPGLIHDKWLLTHRTEDIAKGVALLKKCVQFDSVTIAAKAFYGASFPPDIAAHKVRDWYPAGAEKILIRDVLGVALEVDEIPAQCGILVLNVQTVLAVYNAAIGGPSGARYMTAADLDSRTGTVIRVPAGSGIYETARKVFPKATNVYTGGGAMGACLAGDDDIIGEKTNFIAVGSVRGFREALCSRCNFCSAYCPVHLPVREIAEFMDAGKPEKALRLEPEKCIACSLCSAVCPAGRDQAKRLRAAADAAKKSAAAHIRS